MKKLQQGFTLIELMIVVAIIGILAAIAVPAYQDYTIKSKVSEGASMAGAVRTAIDVAYSEGYTLGGMPVTHATLGLASAASYSAKYAGKVSLRGEGIVVISYKAEKSLGTASGDLLIYVPTARAGNLMWTVSSGSTVPTKYRPKT